MFFFFNIYITFFIFTGKKKKKKKKKKKGSTVSRKEEEERLEKEGTIKIEKMKFSKVCTILVVIIVKIIFTSSFLF